MGDGVSGDVGLAVTKIRLEETQKAQEKPRNKDSWLLGVSPSRSLSHCCSVAGSVWILMFWILMMAGYCCGDGLTFTSSSSVRLISRV